MNACRSAHSDDEVTTVAEQHETNPWPFKSESRFASLDDVYAEARASLDDGVWAFLDGGAGEEASVRGNREAFSRWQFVPRALSGVAPPRTGTSFLGVELSMPVLTGPFGADRLLHQDGHLAVARADAAFGIASIVPQAASYSLEQIAREAPQAARFFQVHAAGSQDDFVRLASAAKDAGYTALCVTVDGYPIGARDRLLSTGFDPDPAVVLANYPDDPADLLATTRFELPVWTWETLAAVHERVDLPMLVKGVLTAADACAAVDAGAAAVLVSNHGGRHLDWAPAPLDQLPSIVAEVGDKVPVALDGGVRRGTDVLKALALGADVVVLGRAAAMGLAAAGETGVQRVLELVHAELFTTMAHCGRETIASIDSSLVQPSPR
jgi:isopentenyl diphosphate isomerase/L-lactate dehydrogenase-like FMN-dependent dehydrogenase